MQSVKHPVPAIYKHFLEQTFKRLSLNSRKHGNVAWSEKSNNKKKLRITADIRHLRQLTNQLRKTKAILESVRNHSQVTTFHTVLLSQCMPSA